MATGSGMAPGGMRRCRKTGSGASTATGGNHSPDSAPRCRPCRRRHHRLLPHLLRRRPSPRPEPRCPPGSTPPRSSASRVRRGARGHRRRTRRAAAPRTGLAPRGRVHQVQPHRHRPVLESRLREPFHLPRAAVALQPDRPHLHLDDRVANVHEGLPDSRRPDLRRGAAELPVSAGRSRLAFPR